MTVRHSPGWDEKVRQATLYRRRTARRAGAPATRADFTRLGWDDDRVLADGLAAAERGCPSCGRPVELFRLALRVVDRGEAPTYPWNVAWRTAPCAGCRRVA